MDSSVGEGDLDKRCFAMELVVARQHDALDDSDIYASVELMIMSQVKEPHRKMWHGHLQTHSMS